MSFNEARQAALPEIAKLLGFKLSHRAGGKFVSKACPACGDGAREHVSYYLSGGTWRWKCFRCPGGGSAIDFVAAAMSLRDREAVDWIVQGGHAVRENFRLANPEDDRKVAVAEAIDKLVANAYTLSETGYTYLRTRGIEPKVVAEACQRGLLRFLPPLPAAARDFALLTVGESLLRKAEILRSSMPAIAYRPIVFPFPGGGSAEFRLARAPSDEGDAKAIRYGHAKWPWYWKPQKAAKTIRVIEGALDMLSLVQMGEKGGIMALPGLAAWKPEWFLYAARVNPGVRFLVSFDNDEPGTKASASLSEFLKANGLPCVVDPPHHGKDWNDMLRRKAA